MKMIKFSRYVVLGAALAVVTGCNDAKLSTIDNGVLTRESPIAIIRNIKGKGVLPGGETLDKVALFEL